LLTFVDIDSSINDDESSVCVSGKKELKLKYQDFSKSLMAAFIGAMSNDSEAGLSFFQNAQQSSEIPVTVPKDNIDEPLDCSCTWSPYTDITPIIIGACIAGGVLLLGLLFVLRPKSKPHPSLDIKPNQTVSNAAEPNNDFYQTYS